MLVNRYHIEGEIAYLELTKDQVTMIDVADLEKALKHTWMASYNKSIDGYYVMRRTETGGSMYLHRYLMDAPKGMYVDHLNHDTLDNRRSNLKLCTNQENNANRNGAYKTSKVGVRGVSFHKNQWGGHWAFRCHCVTCKVAKYFPPTDQGLVDACNYAEWHFKAMENPEGAGEEPKKVQRQRVAPIPKNASGKIDAIGVTIARSRHGKLRYQFFCRREACPDWKSFPYTDEGLETAKQYSAEHYAKLRST